MWFIRINESKRFWGSAAPGDIERGQPGAGFTTTAKHFSDTRAADFSEYFSVLI